MHLRSSQHCMYRSLHIVPPLELYRAPSRGLSVDESNVGTAEGTTPLHVHTRGPLYPATFVACSCTRAALLFDREGCFELQVNNVFQSVLLIYACLKSNFAFRSPQNRSVVVAANSKTKFPWVSCILPKRHFPSITTRYIFWPRPRSLPSSNRFLRAIKRATAAPQ
jgi:hypothetical protein